MIHLSVYLASLNGGRKLLPPANEVWGKVIFSQVSVCPPGGLCMMSLPVWLPGPMFLPGVLCPVGSLSRGSLSEARCLSRGGPGGLCPGGSLFRGSLCRGVSAQGWSLYKGYLSRGGLCREIPESEMRVVHIILECFLVFCLLNFHIHESSWSTLDICLDFFRPYLQPSFSVFHVWLSYVGTIMRLLCFTFQRPIKGFISSVCIQKCTVKQQKVNTTLPLLVIIAKYGFPIRKWVFLFQALLSSGGSRERVPPRPRQSNIYAKK